MKLVHPLCSVQRLTYCLHRAPAILRRQHPLFLHAPPHPKAQVISFVIQLLRLVPGLAADVDAQAAQKVFVHLAEDHREVGVAAPELGQLLLGQLRQGWSGRRW